MINVQIDSLLNGYKHNQFSVEEVIAQCYDRCSAMPDQVWITRLTQKQLKAYTDALAGKDIDAMPLYGVPFVIKDNIDLAGIETTAGCPDYAYLPEKSAFVVEQLMNAGAIPLGKTNLDQFATGLVGTRSPYGACPNAFDETYISGGSSSGSAVAVAQGCCSFSLGTDTAGSGRVPAAFNNLIGVKPSRGLLSCNGVVPACRSLDCVSIFALDSADAERVLKVAGTYDHADSYSRELALDSTLPEQWTFGVPQPEQLKFFGNADYAAAFDKSVELLEQAGGTKKVIDFKPFIDAANLLYSGPWVNERYAAVGEFIEKDPATVLQTTKNIILSGKEIPAYEAFKAMYALQDYKRITDTIMNGIDVLITPTVGTCYTIAEVNADPIQLNTNLGFYTNYMNLLDYCAIAVPTTIDGPIPFGVTAVSFAGHDTKLLQLADKLHRQSGLAVAKTDHAPTPLAIQPAGSTVCLAVCGAHLKGYPLHHQIETLCGTFVRATTTAAEYQMFAFNDGVAKPGLIHNAEHGAAIYLEIYELSYQAFGKFVSMIPSPLGIGKVKLSDGSQVCGFIAEPVVADIGEEITHLADWRKYIAQKA